MTREDIIRMAREAGICIGDSILLPARNGQVEALERFAKLVAAHVRETEFKPDWNNFQQGFLTGAAEEREACAQICEAEGLLWGKHYANAIRKRGITDEQRSAAD